MYRWIPDIRTCCLAVSTFAGVPNYVRPGAHKTVRDCNYLLEVELSPDLHGFSAQCTLVRTLRTVVDTTGKSEIVYIFNAV